MSVSAQTTEAEVFGKDLGLVHEAVVTGRAVGADRAFWKRLAHNRALFQKVVAVVNEKPQFARDMTNEGWELVEDVGFEPPVTSVADLQLVSFLEQGEEYVNGTVMRQRATQRNANLGQQHAEWLLEHQKDIPETWRNHYLVFPGTVWCTREGALLVPCFLWAGAQWCLGFHWLEFDWLSDDRVVSPRN